MRPDPLAAPLAAVIADDLTGALDSVVPFADAGLRCVVATAPAHLAQALGQGAQVIAVSTGSRDLPAGQAAKVAAEVAQALRGVPVMFKKIDSRMKGNIAAEVAAIAQVLGLRAVMICPAIPQMGRVVMGGLLQGFGVAPPMAVAGSVVGLGLRVVAPDATSDGDIDRILAAVAPGTLLVGARGLSAGLARRMGQGQSVGVGATVRLPLPRPIVFVIGSRDPITLAQVAHLLAGQPGAAFVTAPNGAAGALPLSDMLIVQATGGDGVAPSAVVTAALAASLVGLTSPRACLVLTGGETAAAVLAALGIGVLEVVGEALPGLPMCRALGRADGPLIVTKSGGFGDPDTLSLLVDPFRSEAVR